MLGEILGARGQGLPCILSVDLFGLVFYFGGFCVVERRRYTLVQGPT